MPAPAQLASTFYALGAVCSWGISDFVGGYTARRFHSFFLAALGHFSGTTLMVCLALVTHQPFPPFSNLRWAMAAGGCGGVALALFYRALSQGNMGLAAPVSAVIGAALPTAFGMFTEGFQGVSLAMIAGLGFAFFFIFIRQAGHGAALWIAAVSRASSLLVSGTITLVGKKFWPSYPVGFALGLFAGCMDVTGTVLFVRASQTGRLDTAVVLSSLYPALTVLLARFLLKEHFTRWKTVGMIAALASVVLIARG